MSILSCLMVIMVGVVSCCSSPESDLLTWITSLGGTVRGEVKTNSDGVRGLFATEDIAEGEPIMIIPEETVINVGGAEFEGPVLTLMREMYKGGRSLYQPYLDALPLRDSVLNLCNFPLEYISMLQIEFWEQQISGWHDAQQGILDGVLHESTALTLAEAVGSHWRNVTLDDIKYACALSSTRYVASTARLSALLVPAFDLMNTRKGCLTHFQSVRTAEERSLHVLAGEAFCKGDELCSTYGDLRDDYAVVHYGFLLPEEDPPRLCLADHPGNTATSYEELQNLHAETSQDLFEGSLGEVQAEMSRLEGILGRLHELDRHAPPPRTVSGGDYAYDLLLQLQQRRRNALTYAINRLAALLEQAQ